MLQDECSRDVDEAREGAKTGRLSARQEGGESKTKDKPSARGKGKASPRAPEPVAAPPGDKVPGDIPSLQRKLKQRTQLWADLVQLCVRWREWEVSAVALPHCVPYVKHWFSIV